MWDTTGIMYGIDDESLYQARWEGFEPYLASSHFDMLS